MADKLSLFDMLSQAEKSADKANMAKLYGEVLIRKSLKVRKPLSIQLELLPLCNFSCSFCYVKRTPAELEKSGERILRFDDWKYYIDESVKLGVSSITLTGGECTIHPDYEKIFRYAYGKGLQVGMISNGSNITDDILELFKELPPSKIYITIYGMSAETYERTCGNGAAFEKVMYGVDKLVELGCNVILNYTAGKDNFCDMEAVLAYARKKKLAVFPTDALIVKDKSTGANLEKELVDYKKYKILEHQHLSILRNKSFDEFEKNYYSSFDKPLKSTEPGLQCNAGKCSFTVDWHGMIKPCANFDDFTFDPHKIGFAECWQKLNEWADSIPLLEECETCIFQQKCRRCAALHYGDMGEFGKVSPRFCFKKLYPKEAAAAQAKYDEMKANGEIE
ncbi:MAG: radical SAM protein [Eubacterium sp.]|nr:radical SAM protein [Eubacterium sp.]